MMNEIVEDYSSEIFRNDIYFRKLKLIFKDENEEKKFNIISDDLSNKIIALADKDEIKKFLSKDENIFDFNMLIKQLIYNLTFANSIKQSIRFPRRNIYYRKGKYFYSIIADIFENKLPKFSSLYYHVFIFIIDSLDKMNVIKQIIGDRLSKNETTIFFTEYGENIISNYSDIIFE